MEYDISTLGAADMNIKGLKRQTKCWLIAALQVKDLAHKQTITDHAMELSNLREQLEVEKKSAEYWKAEANRLASSASKTEVDLRQSRSFVAKQEQVIRELGNAVTKLGECIAHL